MTKQSRATRIADLNDKFRKGLASGRVHMTAGINAKGSEFVGKALVRVMAFDDFNADNDPHGEHDFGSFELEGDKIFWKIDLYEARDVKPLDRCLAARAIAADAVRYNTTWRWVRSCLEVPCRCLERFWLLSEGRAINRSSCDLFRQWHNCIGCKPGASSLAIDAEHVAKL
jgi:Protein of unknown function (DUF3768)